MNLFYLIILGSLPSLIWLIFFLYKDSDHPEPTGMVVRTFALGMMITLPAAFIEILLSCALEPGKANSFGFVCSFNPLHLSGFSKTIISFFGIVAFTEEFLKYLLIKATVMKTRYFDEPIDALIYPIIIALGFAALENILAIFSLQENQVSLMVWRFVSATLIHALSASLWGYFIALSYFFKKPKYYPFIGLFLGVLFHGSYNLIVSTNNQAVFALLFPLLILPISFIVAMEFKRLHGSYNPDSHNL